MNIVIVDDESPAIQILKEYASRIPFLNVSLATNNPYEVLEFVSREQVDLLLTDIEMPDLSGMELVRSLEQKPLIILTTAYENYALEGYELDVVDYLVKPIRFERFLKAVNKANKIFNLTHQFSEIKKEEYLTIKVEYNTVKILMDDIVYIEGLKDYVKIYTKESMFVTRLNLKGIESKLSAENFIRIHRSYIVSLDKIKTFQKSKIMISNISIPVGSSYREALSRKLA